MLRQLFLKLVVFSSSTVSYWHQIALTVYKGLRFDEYVVVSCIVLAKAFIVVHILGNAICSPHLLTSDFMDFFSFPLSCIISPRYLKYGTSFILPYFYLSVSM